MGKLVTIMPDGTESVTESKKPDYETIHSLLGGYMERIRVRYEGRIRDAYVDEEGLIKGLDRNPKIEKMMDGMFKGYAAPIAGKAIIWVP